VSTLAPGSGGVQTKTLHMIDILRRGGCEPVLAYYEPYSRSPGMSVPSYRVLTRRPTSERRTDSSVESHAIGAWLPELEFTTYLAGRTWRDLIEASSAFVVVSGNVLAALPFVQSGKSFVGWIASDRSSDRAQRSARFSPLRRLLDRAVASPIADRLESWIVRNGTILPVSRSTQLKLSKIAGHPVGNIMPIPVDTEYFTPVRGRERAGRVGFAGRLNDPRKNPELFVSMIAAARESLPVISGHLVGETHSSVRALAAGLGVIDRMEFSSPLDRTALRDWYRSLDVFVVPSHQEGLCIVALEAMACGCPVVSTRCGGTDDFVIEGTTGYIVGHDPNELAAAVTRIANDRVLRNRLGTAARTLVEQRYTFANAEKVFWPAFDAAFPTARSRTEGRRVLPDRAMRPSAA
jgi:glycosyltransferase involved in cell wall biosynthesis